jgi:hypothetical protein
MPLRLVPPSEPDPVEKVRQRVKKMPRPDGALQCNRCGSRTSLTTINGAVILNGKKTGGTVIDKDVCADCYKRGIYSPMLPELKSI